ncbi:MAG: GNAT family N-acetyltransferase [Elusimicrobiota bacterium]|jgi:ribosomal protein S18 acetylase RimI-like enzyme
MDELKLVRLDRRHLGEFERLLSGREFGGCFCSHWLVPFTEWDARYRERKAESFEDVRRRVQEGGHVGYLVLRENDGAVVGWTGAGPKTAFPAMKERPGSRLGPCEDSIWAVGCMAIAFAYRGLGYAPEIVRLVVVEARKAGAKAVEATPLEANEDGGAFRLGKALYERHGFAQTGREEVDGRAVLRMEKVLS